MPNNIENQDNTLPPGVFPDYDSFRKAEGISPEEYLEMQHVMDTEGISAHDARNRALGEPALGIGGLFNGVDPVSTEELPEISRPERFETVKQLHSFFPTSLRELSEIITIEAFTEQKGGVAKHLAEIARHQVKHGYDPAATTTSVVAGYARFAQSARTDLTNLSQLSEELSGVKGNNFQRLDPGCVQTVPGLLVRYLDWQAFARGEHDSREIYPLVRYTDKVPLDPVEYRRQDPSTKMRKYVDTRLASLRLDEARKVCDQAVSDRQAAAAYWTSQLGDIQRHSTGAARVVANGALRKLGMQL